MKDLSKLLLAGLVVMSFTACSDELTTDNGSTPNEPDAVYMQFKLEMPETRSQTENPGSDADYGTSTDGTEDGKSYENKVSEVLVVLAKRTDDNTNNAYITSSTVTIPGGGTQANKDTYIIPFSASALTLNAGNDINVYVFCNPSTELKNDVSNFFNKAYTVTGEKPTGLKTETGQPWTQNKIFMSNANATDRQKSLPASFDNYKTATTPYNLGTIEVERSVARFDYKAGGTDYTDNGNLYVLSKDKDGKATINIELQKAALINLSKSFFYLRRTADDGVSTNLVIGGKEFGDNKTTTEVVEGNYVVDTDASDKKGENAGTTLASNFYYHLQSPKDWVWTELSSITEDDENNSWNTGTSSKGEYKIWRYVTENTIPASDKQKKGITTGIVFKGQIQPTADYTGDLATLLSSAAPTDGTTKAPIYVFNNVLVGTEAMIKAAVIESEAEGKITYKENDPLSYAYQAAFVGVTENGTVTKAGPASVGFTKYEAESDGKYYAYYYYWNRHNDNGNNGLMGPMEFGVVRNNVYKLSVTKIDKFGHPNPGDTDPEDPDPVDPDDPDEEDNVYFQVHVQVLPWTVRINNIEF